MNESNISNARRARPLHRLAYALCTAGLVLSAFGACAIEEDTDEIWIGEEKGDLELVPDETPSFLDEEEAREIFGDDLEDIDDLAADPDTQLGATWTNWYDRDNPDGIGDEENRHLQAGVCPIPSGVECRTVTGLYLWETGENVVCSANDGLICVNANQPDGICNHDYKVRFLCPSCQPNSCAPGQCGWVSDGCGGSIYCGICEPKCQIGQCSNSLKCCSSNGDCPGGFCLLNY